MIRVQVDARIYATHRIMEVPLYAIVDHRSHVSVQHTAKRHFGQERKLRLKLRMLFLYVTEA